MPVLLHVLLAKQTTAVLEAFEELVTAMPQVQICSLVPGDRNIILHVSAPSSQHYHPFVMEKITVHVNITRVKSNFVMKECKNYGPFSL
ncbi:Lrp/AsnC family transcriptional regulator [Mucilaginibacter pocheonensis]|uniref:Lrp/AsnC family transcriptional regulator n=1 Tax=Mucilaginibacter pocheonensis TaxID=398050 RepID=UPI0035B4FC75